MELANARINNFFNKSTDNKYLIDDFVVDEKDANSSVTILTRNVPENSTVLDVGCAQGKFGGYLHDVKGCKMYGIEINEAAVEYVRGTGKYEDVFCFDLEREENSPEYLRFDSSILEVDCILMSDILEHLADPTSVLRKMGQRLRYGGRVLVSVPNIGHADIFLNLMNGIFNYSDLGILDNTHLKFFTKQSFAQWIDDINNYYNDYYYDYNYLGGTFYYSDYLWNIKDNCKPLFNLIENNPDFNILQLLFVLTKKPVQSKKQTNQVFLTEPGIDIVKLLNNAISGNMNLGPLSMFAGEREWYESRVDLLSGQVNSLLVHNGQLEKDTGWLKARNEELERDNIVLKEQNRVLETDMTILKKQYDLMKRDTAWLKEQNSLLERDTAWLKKQNSELELKNRKMEIIFESTSNELVNIQKSLSWRFTGPFRWVVMLFKRIFVRA